MLFVLYCGMHDKRKISLRGKKWYDCYYHETQVGLHFYSDLNSIWIKYQYIRLGRRFTYLNNLHKANEDFCKVWAAHKIGQVIGIFQLQEEFLLNRNHLCIPEADYMKKWENCMAKGLRRHWDIQNTTSWRTRLQASIEKRCRKSC